MSEIKLEFHKDLYDISVFAGLQIKGILKKALLDIVKIIGECFEERKKEEKKI